MSIRKYILLPMMLILFSIGTSAQQDAQFSMYMFNGLFINPAYAGSRDVVSMTAFYRHQWADFDGAPRSASFAVHTPFKNKRNAAGLVFVNDRIGPLYTNSLQLSYAYRIPFGLNNTLSFGLQAGFDHFSARLTDVQTVDPGDPIYGADRSSIKPNFGFGIYIYRDEYFFGLSIPHLLNWELTEDLALGNNDESTAQMFRTYLAHGGYVFNITNNIQFRPTILMKWTPNVAPQFDIAASFMFMQTFWVGVSYRTDDAYNFILEFQPTKAIRIGYTYDLVISDLNTFNRGSHEIMIGYDLNFEKGKVVNPTQIRYF